MNRKQRYILILLALFHAVPVFSQDVSFSQFYSNPLYLNPAFSGSAGVPRISMQYRNQWHSFSKAFTSYSAAIDFPVKKLQGGIGLNVLNDAQANGILNTMQINVSYSVFIQVSKTYRLHGSIQAGFNRNSLNTAELVFADNLDPNYGNHGISRELENLTDPNYNFMDFSTGILMYSERIFFGLAAHHLTEPQQSFYEGNEDVSRLKRKYSAHFGARLPVYLYGHNRKKFDISPQLIVQNQGVFNQLNYGIFATKRGLTGGVWFRQNFGLRYDAIILLVGFFKRSWQFTYSYDFTVSGLSGDTGGTSEVSLVFLFNKNKERKILPFFNQYEEEFGVQ